MLMSWIICNFDKGSGKKGIPLGATSFRPKTFHPENG
jgi:hypothetical protein